MTWLQWANYTVAIFVSLPVAAFNLRWSLRYSKLLAQGEYLVATVPPRLLDRTVVARDQAKKGLRQCDAAIVENLLYGAANFAFARGAGWAIILLLTAVACTGLKVSIK